jgi:hypothetical protein
MINELLNYLMPLFQLLWLNSVKLKDAYVVFWYASIW